MATTTQNDNRAKFLELRSQGKSVADARNATYGPPPVVADATPTTPVAPAPVAPVTPTQPTTPAPIVNAPVDQTTGLSTPLAPAVQPTTPVTPTAPKVDATPGITQDSFNQAKAESEKIKAQNEAQMKLNTQQADLKAQERQQVAQETAKANTPVNQKDVLNALVSGVSVAPQNTQAYRNAQMQYKTYQKFATMTPTQLADNMKMGEIGTETAQLLASNPNYIKAKEDFDKFQKNQSINNMIKSVAEGATGKTTAVDHYQNASDAIAKKLGITETNADAFARIVSQDPETLQLTKTVSNIAKQLNTLNTERNAVYDDLKKQYPDLSASAIMTLMAGRTKEATAQIDALNSSLTLTQADLKMAMEMAKAEYDATKEDITLQAGLAKEDRAMQQALDLSQAQFDQKLAQQAQLTNDPTTAITTMIEEYKKLGIPFTRSTQQVISDFQSSGQDLPTYLSELQKLIQSKPEYQRVQAIQQGQLSDREKFSMQTAVENQRDIRNFAQQKELAYLNKDLSRQQFLFELENDPAQKAKAYELEQKLNANKSLFDVLGKNVGTYEGNRGYDLAGNLGDPLPAGGNWTVKSVDTAGEQVGSIFIGGKGKKPYGNTVVMQDENGNEIRYSHLQDIGVKQGDVLGFGDIVGTRGNTGNVKGANGETLTAEQLKAGRGAHVDVEIKSGGKLLSNADQVNFLKGLKGQGPLTPSSIDYFNSATPTDKKKLQSDPTFQSFQTTKSNVMNDENASIYDVMKYSQGGKDMGEERLKSLGKFSQGLSQIADLSKAIDETDTGPIIGRLRSYNPYDSNAQALIAQINSVVPNIARGVYGEVGVLTDADLQNYAKTLPNIKSTEDTNKLVLAMTLKTMLNGFKGQLQIDGSAGRDVSGFGGTVKQYETKINSLLNSIGGTTQSNTAPVTFKSSNGTTYSF